MRQGILVWTKQSILEYFVSNVVIKYIDLKCDADQKKAMLVATYIVVSL